MTTKSKPPLQSEILRRGGEVLHGEEAFVTPLVAAEVKDKQMDITNA